MKSKNNDKKPSFIHNYAYQVFQYTIPVRHLGQQIMVPSPVWRRSYTRAGSVCSSLHQSVQQPSPDNEI